MRYIEAQEIMQIMRLIDELKMSETPNLLPYDALRRICEEVLNWRENARH